MVLHKDIPAEILPFLGLNENEFDNLPEQVREFVRKGARDKWLLEGAPKVDSLRHPIKQTVTDGDLDELPMEELVEYYYEHLVKQTTLGIEDHRFVLRHSMYVPSPWQYINMISHMATKLQATNTTVQYVDNNDILHNLSFSRDDLRKYTINELLDILRKGADEWRDKGLYSGSDYILDTISTYTLAMKHFTITVCHTRGGYGKMIPDYYGTLGLENNGHDCLIQCFLYIHCEENPHTKCPTVDIIRHYIDKQGKLGVDTVRVLEEMLQIEVDVLIDQRIVEFKYQHPPMMNMTVRQILEKIYDFKAIVVKDETIVIHGTGNRNWKLLYKDEHYDVITKIYPAEECHCTHTGEPLIARKPLSKSQIKRKIIETHLIDCENLTQYGGSNDEIDEDVWYYFFDYETVFDPDTMEILPYAYAIVKCDNKFKVVDTQCHVGLECQQQLSTYLFKEAPRGDEQKYLIGYNNSRFDNFMLIKYSLQHNDYIGTVRFYGNSIVSANINDFKIRDLCRILNMSLDKACKAFKIDLPKLTGIVKHHEVQMQYMCGAYTFQSYLIKAQDTIKTYVIRDCVSLSQLYKVTRSTMHRLVGLGLEGQYTLAGMTYAAFNGQLAKENKNLPIIRNITNDRLVREAIIGGRSQMLLTKREQGDLCAIDCVSLYPYVMLNRKYPIGQPKGTTQYIVDKIGVYNAVIHHQPHHKHNVVPLRNEKTGRLDWTWKGEINCVLCNVDIECLKRHGADVTIKDGLYWDGTRTTLFDQYFKPLITEKQNQDFYRDSADASLRSQYNPAIRETCKLLMNSLSGKLAQRLYEKVTEIVRNAADIDRFCSRTIGGTQSFVELGSAYIAQGKKKAVPTTPCVYGVLIYAYAREHMYESVLRHLQVDELYGMDTDSAFITKFCLTRIDHSLFGDDFGQFKVELDKCDGIFIAPKCYCFYRDNELVKARFKGVKIGNDIDMTEQSFNTPYDVLELYKIYHSNKSSKVGLQTFKTLLEKRKCEVLCCNIEKMVSMSKSKTGLYLSNHTFVKEIKIEDSVMYVNNKDDTISVEIE